MASYITFSIPACIYDFMWINFSEQANNEKILVFHVNVYQTMTSTKKDFNNQVDEVICFVVKVEGMEIIHGISNIDFYSAMTIWLLLLLSAPSGSS